MVKVRLATHDDLVSDGVVVIDGNLGGAQRGVVVTQRRLMNQVAFLVPSARFHVRVVALVVEKVAEAVHRNHYLRFGRFHYVPLRQTLNSRSRLFVISRQSHI